ncbi:patatin-like phospholipase family protein [Sphingomonas sp. LaA6.9]|uniref:patatin-like phospholipase family protein n=1 Tax=Sphingomonas sp. LaA6.9 TaxID=2919914 RepID=UPI001F4FD484|nr:patatin-like phospholipase family protein [Sphingomonas sp. LaA6.9]MCJ8156643.1 patatin-like phospholipase family protein [Sphingomonas sp. LaA6.9]
MISTLVPNRPVRAASWLRALLAFVMLQLLVTGCATPERLPAVPTASTIQADTGMGPIRFFVRRDVSGFEAEAKQSLARELAYRASMGQHGPLPPAYFLAISGGGDNGAFGAGLLNGWSAAGTRPEFKAVTGISTGALIAPFAFLGPKYDPVLEKVYTQVSQRDIFKMRGMIKGFFSDAMADTTPLYELVTRYADQALLDAIAAEYEKGRLLLVGTTALDSLEPVIWNMTAIAASKDPRAPELFRRILVASASIPGAFPPMMLDVTAGGQRYQEMHVDGGTIAQVFLYPPSMHLDQAGASAGRKRILYIIRNARLDPDWASVDRRTLPVATRAISALTQTQGIGDLYRIYTTTRRDGIDYNLAFIPPTFTVPHREEFDTNYMQQLYAVGQQMAAKGYQWQKFPPGYSE